MSIVVCKVTERGGYEIAADSISVRGYTQTKGQTTDHSKLFQVNGLDVGSVGGAQEAALFRLFTTTRKPAAPEEAALLEFLSEFSDWKHKKTGDNQIGNSYIIGFDEAVFAIEQWLVERVVTYEAIGAGMDFALAALHLGHDARRAVETAIELSVFCEGPIQVISRPKLTSVKTA